MKHKVKVFKDGIECGWFKDIVPGANAIIATCIRNGFDITKYHFSDYDNVSDVVWRGEDYMLKMEEA